MVARTRQGPLNRPNWKKMLLELTVENIATIERATLSLGGGLTALTGETGAGKSLLIDSISLALGSRADPDLVRTGCAKASVVLLADVRANAAALAKCAELGIAADSGQLVLQRDLSAEGRSVARVNGRPVAVGSLRELGRTMVDLHGQHDHQSLLDPLRQVEFLDGWIGDEASGLLVETAELFGRVESLARKLSNLRSSVREREQRRDLLTFQIQEIEETAPGVGESEALTGKISRLKGLARLTEAVSLALAELADSEGSSCERLGVHRRSLSPLVDTDPELSGAVDALVAADIALDEAARQLRGYRESLESDPDDLESCAARLDLLSKLRRKYGESDSDVLDYLVKAKIELEELDATGVDEEEIARSLEAAKSDLKAAADRLTALRHAKSAEFDGLVASHLRDLTMEKAEFEVSITPGPIQPNGQDLVEFRFSANPGEDMRPLHKVASGGELSRVMLAIKVASARRAGVPSLIFDEVDAGLSGRAAAATASKLKALSADYQVIVISHLPQIASQARSHLRIEKVERYARTETVVTALTQDERVEEIARMLAGESVGESALANARELLS